MMKIVLHVFFLIACPIASFSQFNIIVKTHDDIYSTNFILPVKVTDSVAKPYLDDFFFDSKEGNLLEFYDEFEDSVVNPSSWVTYSYAQKGLMNYDGAAPGEIQYLAPENVVIKDGKAQVIAKLFNQEKLADNSTSDQILFDGQPNLRFYRYSSGQMVSTQEIFYGRLEARIRIPLINNVWPAFWLFGGDQNDVPELNYADRRCEIDVFEFVQSGRKMLSTIHLWSSRNGAPINFYDGNSYTATNFFFEENWHNYRMVWNQYQLEFYLDNERLPGTHFHYYAIKKGDIPTISVDGNKIVTDQNWGLPIRNGFDLMSYSSRGYDIYVNRLFPNRKMPVILGMGIKQTNDPPLIYNEENKYKIVNDKATFPVIMEIDWVKYFSNVNQETLFDKTELILANSNYIGLYPNPAMGELNLENTNGSDVMYYEIFDVLGHSLISGTSLSNSCQIDVSDLRKGFYFVNIKTGNRSLIKSFIKN
jgi:hypothetical protein